MTNRVDQPIRRVDQNSPKREYAVPLQRKIRAQNHKVTTVGGVLAGAQEQTRSAELNDRRTLSIVLDAILVREAPAPEQASLIALEASASGPTVPHRAQNCGANPRRNQIAKFSQKAHTSWRSVARDAWEIPMSKFVSHSANGIRSQPLSESLSSAALEVATYCELRILYVIIEAIACLS